MDLGALKAVWVDVLDDLERNDRIAWLAFFDARLAALDGDLLTLDFSDSAKLAGGHDLREPLPAGRIAALESAIARTTGSIVRCVVSPTAAH